MSKQGYLSRYLLILNKLKAKSFISFEELQNYLDNRVSFLQMQDDNLKIGFSKRTLQRDIKEIRNIFGVDIEYSKKEKGYFISQSVAENLSFYRMTEAFDLFNSLNIAHDLKPYVHLENRKPQGTENLYGLIHAIKNKFQIKFLYQAFAEDESRIRSVEPYILKEFKNRWYILAKDLKEGLIKSFALDRLLNLEITKKTFASPNHNEIEETYRYCFGIISPNGKSPEEIVLSFEPYQGKYIKSLPLHDTQQILIDSENELQVKLKLYITYDLVIELLSFGETLKVIKPKSLIKEIRDAHEKAYKNYNH